MFFNRTIVIIEVFIDAVVEMSNGATYIGTLTLVTRHSVNDVLSEAQFVVQGTMPLSANSTVVRAEA